MSKLELKNLYDDFRDSKTIKSFAKKINEDATKIDRNINIMEVCGGHTHTIMKYGILQLLPENINFIHGPGCPVCIMPKERIDHAYILAQQPDVILVTLGDMIKVPGSHGSLQNARSEGADVRFVYSPLDVLKIAKDNPSKKVIFYAIGFETTTPMSAVLLEKVIKQGIKNVFFHINHVRVPEPMRVLMDDKDCQINAFLGPSHVSAITGSKIYEEFPLTYHTPVVVSGFEPVDVMQSIYMILRQFITGRCEVENEYGRAVTREGNVSAQRLVEKYFDRKDSFRWRGIGDIPKSSLKLRDEYAKYDAEIIYADILPDKKIDDHKLCICGEILKGKAKPMDCKVFGNACKPSSPLGSCMVSSEGACAAYYKYGNIR